MKATFSLCVCVFTSIALTMESLQANAQCTPPADIDVESPFIYDFEDKDDIAWDVIEVDNGDGGGFVIVGSTVPTGTNFTDVLVVFIDENLDLVWAESYGGLGDDIAYSLIQSSYNDKIIVCGKINDDYFTANDFTDNIWLLEIDLADGSLDREAQYGSSGNETGFAIAEAPSGQYVIAGKTGNYTHDDEDLDGHVINGLGDYWVLEVDPSDLSLDWDMNFHGMYTGGTTSDQATGVMVDAEGNYIVTGSCISCDPNKIQDELMLVKIEPDNSYDTTMRYYGDDTERDQVGWDVIESFDGGYVSCGISHPDTDDCFNGQSHDFYVVKTDNTLVDLWTPECYHDEGIVTGGNKPDNAYGLANACSGFLIVGESRSESDDVSCNWDAPPPPARDFDAWLVKLDDNSAYEWDASFGDFGDDVWHSIKRLADGSYIMAGAIGVGDPEYLTQDFYAIKFQVADCGAPQDLDAYINEYCALLTWTMEPCVPSYDLIYRKVGGSWTTVLDATSPKIIVNPSATGGDDYEWRVRANCSPDYDAVSSLEEFELPWCTGTRTGCSCSVRLEPQDSAENLDQLISLFPNPSADIITVSVTVPDEEPQKTLVEIHNHHSKCLYSAMQTPIDGKLDFEISLKNFAAGVYFLSIVYAGKIFHSKFVIQ